MWQAYCNYYDCMLNESKWFCDSLGKTMFSWPSQQTLPDLQSKRLPSVICKIVNSGRICWNILNFFGPFGPMLRTLQWSFTDNRLKCNPLGPPARAPLSLPGFYQYSPFTTSPLASPRLQANGLPTTSVRAPFAIFVFLSVLLFSSGLRFPYMSVLKYQLPGRAFSPTLIRIILWVVNFIHSLEKYQASRMC